MSSVLLGGYFRYARLTSHPYLARQLPFWPFQKQLTSNLHLCNCPKADRTSLANISFTSSANIIDKYKLRQRQYHSSSAARAPQSRSVTVAAGGTGRIILSKKKGEIDYVIQKAPKERYADEDWRVTDPRVKKYWTEFLDKLPPSYEKEVFMKQVNTNYLFGFNKVLL